MLLLDVMLPTLLEPSILLRGLLTPTSMVDMALATTVLAMLDMPAMPCPMPLAMAPSLPADLSTSLESPLLPFPLSVELMPLLDVMLPTLPELSMLLKQTKFYLNLV